MKFKIKDNLVLIINAIVFICIIIFILYDNKYENKNRYNNLYNPNILKTKADNYAIAYDNSIYFSDYDFINRKNYLHSYNINSNEGKAIFEEDSLCEPYAYHGKVYCGNKYYDIENDEVYNIPISLYGAFYKDDYVYGKHDNEFIKLNIDTMTFDVMRSDVNYSTEIYFSNNNIYFLQDDKIYINDNPNPIIQLHQNISSPSTYITDSDDKIYIFYKQYVYIYNFDSYDLLEEIELYPSNNINIVKSEFNNIYYFSIDTHILYKFDFTTNSLEEIKKEDSYTNYKDIINKDNHYIIITNTSSKIYIFDENKESTVIAKDIINNTIKLDLDNNSIYYLENGTIKVFNY